MFFIRKYLVVWSAYNRTAYSYFTGIMFANVSMFGNTHSYGAGAALCGLTKESGTKWIDIFIGKSQPVIKTCLNRKVDQHFYLH